MASIAETVMVALLARLQDSPALAPDVRRSHRTIVDRDHAPAIHLIDGSDTPTQSKNDCRTDRKKAFTVRIFRRDDAGVASADPTVIAVNARLDPVHATYQPYPGGAVLHQGRIVPAEEIADGNAVGIDMEFEFYYCTGGWTLE
jgi:hypothetical protein